MNELFSFDSASLLAVSFGVGIVIGLTGMGGGALMTPALIFLGIPASTAIANDLVAATINKSVGATVHWRNGSPNFQLAKWLILGSVPTAFLGAFFIDAVGTKQNQEEFLKFAIGCTLLLAAGTYTFRMYLDLRRGAIDDLDAPDPTVRVLPTVLVGIIGGTIVGLTSVGSGSLMMAALLLMYPTLAAVKLVGTDLVQAIPLVFSAAVGHVIVTGVDWVILIPLIIGGTPGTFVGARISNLVSQVVIRRGIVMVLTLTGITLLGVSPVAVGLLGAAMVILGPLFWGVVRPHGQTG